MRSADIVIVGGGTAGCVAASEAALAGRSVILIEAGPDFGPLAGGRWPAGLLKPWTLPTGHDWGLTETLPDGRSLALERGRVMGGSSSVNGCVACWGSREDYDDWQLDGWSGAVMRDELREVSDRLRVRTAAPEQLTPFQRACLDAAVAIGLPFQPDVNDLDSGPGVGAVPSTTHGMVRHNAAFAFLDDVRGSVTVLANRTADRLVITGDRVAGVRMAGGEAIGAGLVVLAAGTYGSPAILLRSGVGPPGDLTALGITPVVSQPGVGANLHDQPTVDVELTGSAELVAAMEDWLLDRKVADEPIVIKARSGLAMKAFDLHVFPVMESPFEGREWRWVLPVACLTPESRGRLRLRSANPAVPPLIDHAFLSAAGDVQVLLDGIELVRALVAAPELRRLAGAELSPGPVDLARWVRANHHHYWHPVGTCAMGTVTDPSGRVDGLSNCLVVDASVMPAVPRANTNLPTAAVAQRLMRSLLQGAGVEAG
ncbi:GMC family oxidoreductase [Micromonospora sp. NPDC047557]|uniref:GMC family oxidoreductase n=1 Tax=Micromonospora sp. NPDC047557 TaxID=3364250 RepID=UPI003718C66C